MRVRFTRGLVSTTNLNALRASLLAINFGAATVPISAGVQVYGQDTTYDWKINPTAPGVGIALTDYQIDPNSFTVPYMSKYKCALVTPKSNAATDIIGINQPQIGINFNGSWNVANATQLYRAIAEDFQFCYFIACPPLFVSTT